ncbi:sugar transporter [Sphingobacterium humi]|uniref:Sugar transporter n=2 Tax=Sphingobacterium humi TaxID=1796905 RepID=A0A6N8L1Q3_9SPHI|nr:sugar transporter [Sphingobacterium humi]
MFKQVNGYVILLITICIFGCTSCASKKDVIYFQADSVGVELVEQLNIPKLQSGDILAISVTADDIRATQPFNQVSAYQSGTLNNSNPFIPTYTIDSNGEIYFPKIGKVVLAGKTRAQAIEFLKLKVSHFIVDPGVSIEIRNFRVTVLGEVLRPGSFAVENDRITLLEALGLAGDLTIYGNRKEVLVIREHAGIKKEYKVDLTKKETLNSPVYYLSQNDVIYIPPNGARVQTSKYTQNTSVFVSVIGLIITVISVLTR